MFETYIYAPFFNILVGIYWVLGRISPDFADMGIAVIIFSLVIRVILFPLTIAGERSEEEKRKIVAKVNELKQTFSHDPVRLKEEIKLVMRSNVRSVIATTVNLVIQGLIIILLYRIFTTGLEGADFHLLYDFMPNITYVNLMFLGKYDLSHTNATLNLIQSVMIFVVEILIALRSPFPLSRRDKALMQVILPVGSYLIFMFLPAGKKLFVISSLAFSALYNSLRLLQDLGRKLSERFSPPPIPTSTTPTDLVTASPPPSDQPTN